MVPERTLATLTIRLAAGRSAGARKDGGDMPREIHGQLTVDGQRFAIVVSRFNEFITSKLLSGAIDALKRHGCDEDNITCVHVPGAFELPFMAKKLAESGSYDAVICLGCVIRGQTPHFEYIAGQAARGVSQAGLATGVPTTFGVITADTLEQAVERAGSKAGNKGVDAAISAIELTNVLKQLPVRS
jgi:6,7-dimethyl-8-ribityllumazine synthase